MLNKKREKKNFSPFTFFLPADMVEMRTHSHSLHLSLSLGYRFVKKPQRGFFTGSPFLFVVMRRHEARAREFGAEITDRAPKPYLHTARGSER